MKNIIKLLIILILAGSAVMIAIDLAGRNSALKKRAALDAFFAPPADRAGELPADGFFPNGRRFVFTGYSGKPERDLTNGFTVAGAVYGDQMPYLAKCFTNGWPVIAHIGPHITFSDKAANKYKIDEKSLRAEVAGQVQALAPCREIVWWAVHPEELRPWRGDEMRYLEIVCEVIRGTDPLKRPIYLYNPNHRNAESLQPIARLVDVVAKGCYVNSCGKKRERGWVRWSIEQEREAIEKAGRPGAFPVLMPELCRDPEPGEEREIDAWVRHDIYLGMVSGAKAVKIWSLFKRREVAGTYDLWYNAYARCARELTGGKALAQVFLFGEKRDDLAIGRIDGGGSTEIALGGGAEPTTTTEEERDVKKIAFESWSSSELAYGSGRYLFIVNSANTEAAFAIAGWPDGSVGTDLFTDTAANLPRAGRLVVELPPYGVKALRFSKAPAD